MAEVERPDDCCAAEAHANCCDTGEKDACCKPGVTSCGCGEDNVRELVPARYTAGARGAALALTDGQGDHVFGAAS